MMLLPTFLSSAAAAALLFLSSPVVADYPNPGACTGSCYTRDPAFIKRADGKYFRFNTKDRISIHTAPQIQGPWTQVGSVIQGKSIIDLPGNADLWAPDISRVGDLYYLFYAVSTLGSRTSAIGYATSPNMEPGTWTDRGAVVTSSESSTPYNAIDGNLYHSADGKELHLQWGSYWQGIYTQPVTIEGTKVALKAGTSPKNVAYLPTQNNAQEGAFVYLKNGAWWLFLSRGKAGEFGSDPNTFPADQAYRVFVCRGDSPTGPFFGKLGKNCLDGGGTEVYASFGNVWAPGGQGVWQDDVHGDVLYYHYFNRNTGYGDYDSKFGWNVLKWIDGWPVAV